MIGIRPRCLYKDGVRKCLGLNWGSGGRCWTRIRALSSVPAGNYTPGAASEADIGILQGQDAPPRDVYMPPPPPSPPHKLVSRQHAPGSVREGQSNSTTSYAGKTGGEVFHDMMVQHKVKHIFGYPGGAILPVFDAIYRSPNFDFILPRHEQGAGHMAQGYSRATGKPGVVLVTSGPGATNLITPMMDALADGTPLVVFAGQVNSSMIGLDAFQEVDMLSMSRPCTKWNVRVRSPAELEGRIDEAFEIATARGRPGPVLVELPQDVTACRVSGDGGGGGGRPCGQEIYHLDRASPSPSTLSNPGSAARRRRQLIPAVMANEAEELRQALRETARLINVAKKPVLYVGQGALAAPQGPLHIKTLADKASIPVTTSLQGLGAFDEDDPMALHMLGLHGAGYANLAVQHADLIIALGARFDDRVTGDITKFAPAAQQAARQARGGVVHFDISPKNINKVVQATVSVVGDCAVNLERLLPYVKETQRPSWLAQIQAWKDKYPFSAYSRGSDAGNKGIPPQRVIERLSELVAPIKDRTIITTGVGQHQMWAAQHFRWKHPRTMITSGGLGTMGFGLPAAIGAKVARPDALVIDIDGDASFNMTLNELQTASQYGIGVKVLVLNNEEQGMVTHLQRVYYQNRFSHSYNLNPDFVRTARAMGVQARRCLELGELDGMLEWLLDSNGPALLEVRAAPGALSLPMVPSGKGLDEFLFYDDICAF